MNIKKLENRLFESVVNDSLEYRTNYFRDRSRIIHSAAFRRLQGKTQVLGLGDSDFYRTRLTHSLEVASLCQSISKYLASKIESESFSNLSNENYKELSELISGSDYEYLLEAIGLAHDIGHPPFGHGGERALHIKMRNHGGFEGNAQTLRILNKLAEYEDEKGLNPTLRLALGVLKYPISFGDAVEGVNNKKPPKCIYIDDKQILINSLSKYLPENDISKFFSTKKGDTYLESVYKSFDCAIMEIADDISYAVHDLEDGVALKLLKKEMFNSLELQEIFDKAESCFKSKIQHYENADDFITKLCSDSNKKRKKCINTLIYLLINSTVIAVDTDFESSIFKYTPKLSDWAKKLKKYFFDKVKNEIIKSPEVQHLELKGEMIVSSLFDILMENADLLLEVKDRKKINADPAHTPRVVCDYIAGMTDSYASKIYKRIFIPDSGSVFDRL